MTIRARLAASTDVAQKRKPSLTTLAHTNLEPTASEEHSDELTCLWHMLLSRESDRREAVLHRQGKAWFQIPSLGHEPLAVIPQLLNSGDYIFPSYRDRAMMIGRGITMHQLALDFFGKQGSSSEGRNMPGHFSSREHNVFSVASPTGSQCLPAVGVAWGLQGAKSINVVLCNIGDASTRQGEFYEAVCHAVQCKLPIVFLVEDNGYGISTKTDHMMPLRLGIFDRDLVSYVDGRNVRPLRRVTEECVARARRGAGPSIIWCELDRLGSHTSADDHRTYRPLDEIEGMRSRECIAAYSAELIADGILTAAQFEVLCDDAQRIVAETYLDAEQSPIPPLESVTDQLFGTNLQRLLPQPKLDSSAPMTMVAAINQTFRAGLEAFPNMLMFGEDIEDPKGGVFGLTKGLSASFPGRVTNSPLAEATIVGTAVGLAASGYRPVFELQFIDFLTAGFNPLASQMATLRWRSAGDWSCPAVLYAPYGAYTPGGGTWHSQSNDGWWAHMPGLRVAVPSTPQDAASLFWAAFQQDDPTLILIPKFVMRERMSTRDSHEVKFGQAQIRREGSDVTLVGWGNTVGLALDAAQRLDSERGVKAEVIDLVSLAPCDWKTIETSLAKTGRIVVVQEDGKTCGFGQAVISEISSNPDRFYMLAAPPRLIAREDGYVPYSPYLEDVILPNVDRIVTVVSEVLE